MRRKKWEGFQKYMGIEIEIEYKACLYFYCILFFYCCYQVLQQTWTASILHMAEMIGSTYLTGYLQVFLLGNFDEAEKIGKREAAGAVLCSAIYTVLSYVLGWFDKKTGMTVVFALFLLFAYFCVFLINKIKRQVDTRQLNAMLSQYKEEGEEDV